MRRWVAGWWRAIMARRRFERDLNDELRLHLELHEDALVRTGLSRREAARRARADFGSLDAARDACRDTRQSVHLDELLRDLRIAARRLRATPGFLAAAACTLALGLSANTLIYVALHSLLLKPLPFVDGSRLTWIVSHSATDPGQEAQVSDEDVKAIAARARSLDSLAVIGDATLIRERPERFDRWHGLAVTRALFDVLRVAPAVGAPPSHDQMSASIQPMLVSYERWKSDFDGNPALIGRTLAFADNKRFTVTGVLPPRLPFPFLRPPLTGGNGSGFEPGVQDFWIVNRGEGDTLPGGVVISRLRASATLEELNTDLHTVVAASPQPGPDAARRLLAAVPLRDQSLGVLKPALPLLQTFAMLLFIIACANLANLLLARGTAQVTDHAIRLALGAGGRHIWRLALAESMVIAGLGGSAAIGLVLAGLGPLVRLAGTGYEEVIQFDATAAVLLAALSFLAVAGCVVAPTMMRAKAPLTSLLGDAPRGTPPRTLRGLRTLVAIQLALSLVLLAGAGALRTSLTRLIGVDAGYRPTHVLTADILLYVPKSHERLTEIYARIRAIPGVETLGVVHSTPLTGKWQIRDRIEIVEGGSRVTSAMTGGFVAFDYFQAMGIELVEGRFFTDEEPMQPDPRPVIINDLAAKAYFPGRSAVGAELFMYGAFREVVGVVRATRDVGLDVPAEPQFYQPGFFDGSQMAIRVNGEPARYVDVVRQTLESSDPRLIVNNVRPLDSIIAERVADRRTAAQLVAVFGVLALMLAGVGLAGVLHFSAARRAREMGLRTALGASPRHLIGLVAREAIAMFVPGVICGVALVALVGGSLRAILFEASIFDPLTLVASVAVLITAGGAAVLVPAWRVSRVNPLVVLRK